jgi:iron complex outermembrane receptor protein
LSAHWRIKIKIGLWLSSCLFFRAGITAQDKPLAPDTLAGTDSLEITGQLFGSLNRNLSSASLLRTKFNQIESFAPISLVPAINTLAGVRMEERSPGSYRLNIRGSSLRSPFGVRNVKMYWNGIPFTDAGGNTYFNQLATNSVQTTQILRGPAASMYGAGTGGLVMMQSIDGSWQQGVDAAFSFGSFGTQSVLTSASFGEKENKNRISYAHNKSDGYRQQSALRRDNATWTSQFRVTDKQQLTASLMYTNLFYQTPGGLTLSEYENDPNAARPAAGGFPSAEAANAAIGQQNLVAGFNSIYKLSSAWRNTTALYGAFALVENAAIRNYENRTEPQLGGRTVFSFDKIKNNTTTRWQTGVEYQAGFFNTQVSKNKNGTRDSLLTNDNLQFHTGFVFTQIDFSFSNRFFATGGFSINSNKVSISRLSALPVVEQQRTYRNEWAPRVQLTYRWPNQMETQATYSRGFSPPTAGELLPSTGRISTDLEAETGDNYELAQTVYLLQKKLRLDITAFLLLLKNTLVQQRDAAGADFFVNAGETRQQGIETSLSFLHQLSAGKRIKTIHASLAYTYSDFSYSDYSKLGVDYSGNQLPGVPQHSLSLLGNFSGSKGWYANMSWYFNSAIMLNDANNFEAAPFHLVGAKLGYRFQPATKWILHVFAGADNLLDMQYSLGNDINAAGNRFYNAAPTRNFYGGVGVELR